MRIVVDANVLAAARIQPHGWTASTLQRPDLELHAPHAILEEVVAHAGTFRDKSTLHGEAWERWLGTLLNLVHVVPPEETHPHDQAELVERVRAVDPKDAIYAACAVAIEAEALWTYDKEVLAALPGIAVTAPPDPHNA